MILKHKPDICSYFQRNICKGETDPWRSKKKRCKKQYYPNPGVSGNSRFPWFPGIQASNFPSLPFPWHFKFSLPVPGKRKFWTGIRTGNTFIISSFSDGGSRHENKYGISRLNSRPKLPFPGNGKGNYKMPREGKGKLRESWEEIKNKAKNWS